jgi:hypothetical protein
MSQSDLSNISANDPLQSLIADFLNAEGKDQPLDRAAWLALHVAHADSLKSSSAVRIVFALVVAFLTASSVPAQEIQEAGLVVVVPAALERSLTNYIVHKRKQMPVEVVTLEIIRSAHPDADDDAHRVKLELYQRWKQKKIAFVLLVGGTDIMPVRYRTLVNPDFGTPGNLVYSMSDHYYADVANAEGEFEDWNGRKEGLSEWQYGESRMIGPDPALNADVIDFYPELAVGRWPVSNAAGARMMAAKTIRYETGLQDRKKTDSTDAVFLLWDDLANRNAVTGWRNQLADWRTEYRDALGSADQRPDSDAVLRLLNSGTRLVFDFGHGSPDGWSGLRRKHLPGLQNADKLPVAISIGCDTTPLGPGVLSNGYRTRDGKIVQANDPEYAGKVLPPPDVYQPELRSAVSPSFGHEMVAGRPTGAVAYIGFILNSNHWNELLDGFVGSISDKEKTPKRLGECWRQALVHQRKARAADIPATGGGDFGSFYAYDQGLRTILLGDPTLLLSSP